MAEAQRAAAAEIYLADSMCKEQIFFLLQSMLLLDSLSKSPFCNLYDLWTFLCAAAPK